MADSKLSKWNLVMEAGRDGRRTQLLPPTNTTGLMNFQSTDNCKM